MALKLGPREIPWWRKGTHESDPYWDFFIKMPPADRENLVAELIRRAPEGNVFPTKTELHSPEITSAHVKELARYLGADLVGIARLPAGGEYPFAVVSGVRAQYDPRDNPGVGGQVAAQNGLFITFVLSAWIRELGYRATAQPDPDAERLAAAAGLGTLDAGGRLVSRDYGRKIHIGNVIRTDLPLAPD
ncbi:MAG TPA: hypothetical protein VNL14_08265 [Candidatus Acidoferrales bacterium]|nr:hypothetical protein [Candidatus Acidoferrales bacterium]